MQDVEPHPKSEILQQGYIRIIRVCQNSKPAPIRRRNRTPYRHARSLKNRRRMPCKIHPYNSRSRAAGPPSLVTAHPQAAAVGRPVQTHDEQHIGYRNLPFFGRCQIKDTDPGSYGPADLGLAKYLPSGERLQLLPGPSSDRLFAAGSSFTFPPAGSNVKNLCTPLSTRL